ncbi:phosphoethanolamine transferase [Dialister hominis]|uniref:Phosphoethanolamine transferase CptA n=2 Tax=Dialister TaxID=39948 RepID=A0A8D5A2P4_9FIRM|nr:phosphoethanolamine transferase [Dialister hominis]BBK25793.1 phosphoethanolamine transferase CptA [Dialister hominis]
MLKKDIGEILSVRNITKKDAAWYCLVSIIFTAVLWGWFAFTGIKFLWEWNLSLRDALLTFVTIFLLELTCGQDIRGRLWHAAYPGFLALMLVFPYVIGTGSGNRDPDFRHLLNPYVMEALGFLSISVITAFWQQKARRPLSILIAIGTFLITTFQIICALIYFSYFLIYGSTFATADFLPFVQTHLSEAIGFLKSFISVKTLCLGVILLLVLFVPTITLLVRNIKNGGMSSAKWPKWIIALSVLLFAAGIINVRHWIPRSFPVLDYQLSQAYIHSIRDAKKLHTINAAKLVLANGINNTLASRVPGTVLLVIGESETSDLMTAFTPSLPVDTTPWLTSEKENKDFYLFNHAYTNFPATAGALSMALTGINQYNEKEIGQVVTLLDVAKKAGYDTWWISNHRQLAAGNPSVDLVSSGADHTLWTTHAEGADIDLISLLKKVPRNGNHFIILHLMGSHAKYDSRIPDDWPYLSLPGADETENDYATTVDYTDYVLKNIFNYSKENLHMTAMAYLSDHGEDMKYGHGEGHVTWSMLHIPLFFYLSPEYETAFPNTAKALRNNREKIFTNDLLFDTMCGLIQAPNNDYSPTYDLTSPLYSLNADQALAVNGKWIVANDPSLHDIK